MRVVYYEGLGGRIMNHLKKTLIKELRVEFPIMEFEQRFWKDKSELPRDTICVIGHSFGGYRAIEAVNKADYLVPLLMTYDARLEKWVNEFKSSNAKLHANFWQHLPLAGSPIEYATVNSQYLGRTPFVGHMRVTSDNFVLRSSKKYLRGAMQYAQGRPQFL